MGNHSNLGRVGEWDNVPRDGTIYVTEKSFKELKKSVGIEMVAGFGCGDLGFFLKKLSPMPLFNGALFNVEIIKETK